MTVRNLSGVRRPHRAGRSPLRLAVIDDDTGFLTVLDRRVTALGWQSRVLGRPVAVERLVAMRVDAVVIDLALAGTDAWSYLEAVCGRLPEVGVVVCTAPVATAARVRGLRLGADDWIAKPCHPDELAARVEAVARRRRASVLQFPRPPLVAGELELHPDRFEAFVRGAPADLTRREFELLALLATAPDVVLEREDIYQRVWGYAVARGDRSVDVYVRKLRLKLDRLSPGWRYIHTHFGIGYRFAPEPPAPAPRELAATQVEEVCA
jgi:DNA-binding response OmpR family regulator